MTCAHETGSHNKPREKLLFAVTVEGEALDMSCARNPPWHEEEDTRMMPCNDKETWTTVPSNTKKVVG